MYWTGPGSRGGRGGVGSAAGSAAGSGVVGHERERYGRRPDRAGPVRTSSDSASVVGSVARPSTTSTPGRASRIDGGAMTFHDREPPPSTTRSRCHDPRIDPDRQLRRQPEDRHAADLHARDLARRLGRRERRLAGPEPVAHRPVDVQAVRGEDDARRVARRVALADDEDRVGRVLRREPVGRAERGRVGEGRIAREQLVLDAERLERRRRAGRARPDREKGRGRSS